MPGDGGLQAACRCPSAATTPFGEDTARKELQLVLGSPQQLSLALWHGPACKLR